jgi:hypothetical protein
VLKPGQRGTKKLVEVFGEHLLCVRYRYDWRRRKRLKTVELVVGESKWQPTLGYMHVGVRLGYEEEELRAKVKAAGAYWRKDEKLWEMPHETATRLGLWKRVVRSL